MTKSNDRDIWYHLRLIGLTVMVLMACAVVSEVRAQEPGLIINGEATATITWQAPTDHEDGTALDPEDIAGYALYWGIDPGAGNCSDRPTPLLDPCYGNALDLTDGTLTTTQLTFALNGETTLYFVGVAYVLGVDGDPLWSRYSNEISRRFVLSITQSPPAAPVLIDIVMSVTCTTNRASVTCEFSVE